MKPIPSLSLKNQLTLYALARNYLELGDKQYYVSHDHKLYYSETQQATLRKILKLVSYALIFPVVVAYATKKRCHSIYENDENIKEITQETKQIVLEGVKPITGKEKQTERIKQIQQAKHNIFVKGASCEKLLELLPLIDTQMKTHPSLNTFVYSKHSNTGIQTQIQALKKNYGNRFTFVYNPNLFGLSECFDQMKFY